MEASSMAYYDDPSDDDDDEDESDAERGGSTVAPADPAAVAYSADQDPYLAYRVTARNEITRDALPSPVHETEMLNLVLPLRKRPCRTTPGPGYEVGESSAAGAARQDSSTSKEVSYWILWNMGLPLIGHSIDALPLLMEESHSILVPLGAQYDADELAIRVEEPYKTHMIELIDSRDLLDPAKPELPEEAIAVLRLG
ncbi:hypothetical protein Tco_0597815 [Tanacetum coccineum]